MSNRHIEDFLDYYCALENPPEYAVMLKGKWGCGKTWFIKKYCEKLKEKKQKYLYVSLYGITSFEEIKNMFFQELHPILSSKIVNIFTQIAKESIPQLPTINIQDYLINIDSYIIVFDDLERCGIELNDILGHINFFVEHKNVRVIIIANEEEICFRKESISKETSESLYFKTKEKLIGKTFEITSEIDEILSNLINSITNNTTKEKLEKNKEIIKDIYMASGYNNIRHLKQALLDFDRLYSILDDNFTSNEEFNENLLKVFLEYSFEIRGGSIVPTELASLTSGYFHFKDKDPQKIKYEEIALKYNKISFFDHTKLLTHSLWELFFDKGIIDKDDIKESLKNSVYFETKYTENWVKLWNFRDLDDNTFCRLYKKILQEIDGMVSKKIGEFKHIIGLFLTFAEYEIIDESKEAILEKAKKYIDHIEPEKLLALKPSIFKFEDDDWRCVSSKLSPCRKIPSCPPTGN